MQKFLSGQGEKRNLAGIPKIIRDVMSVIAALYLVFAVLLYPEPILHRSIAFGLFYFVLFVSFSSPGVKRHDRVPVYDWILAGLSLSVSLYIGLSFRRIMDRMVFVDSVSTVDIMFCAIAIILLIEGTRRIIGPWLPGLSIIALAYIIFGHYIPGRFGHLQFNIDFIVDGLFLSNHGIWGSTMGIATGKIMIFLLFGTIFIFTGAGDFLFDFVSKIAGKSKGGVAKIAILASAMFGMVSGGALTNVTTTGSMTIPAMKKSGFSKEYSASVESCASVGGIFMPPIMGSVAFIMSDVIGIPYVEIVQRAILPAIVYFSALFFAVDFRARKKNILGKNISTKESLWSLLLRGYNFFLPLGFLVFRLMSGRTAAKAGLETIVLMLILSLFNRKKPLTFKLIINSLITSVNRGLLIVSTMAMCGVLIGVINLTGITAKFSSYLLYISDISVILTLITIMLVTLFLGLAMSISSTYLIVAVLGAPILISLGFEQLSVHMFILFFATMATITPPVAITSFAAATIAGAPPMKVSFLSMKVGMVAYILPFVFIFSPAILLYGSLIDIAISFILAIIGTGIIAMGMEGWFFGWRTGIPTRGLLIIAGIMIVLGQWVILGIASGATLLLFIYNLRKNNQIKKMEAKDENT